MERLALASPSYYQAAMSLDGIKGGLSRRTFLVGGGAGVGLLLAWNFWPRSYEPNLRVAPGETLFNAYLKIGTDGRVIVAIPQAELGQGSYTSLAQIIADELGADWRTVAVEPTPLSPLYGNSILSAKQPDDDLPSALQVVARRVEEDLGGLEKLMLTGGSTSIRAFEQPLREAGAAARALLSKVAANRWDVDWETLDAQSGFVVNGNDKIRFGELSEAAAEQRIPDELPMRGGIENRLTGQPLPRLDLPSKVDGSAQYAGDIRLPNMVFASVRRGPYRGGELVRIDRDAAEAVPGVLMLFENPGWVGAAATNWWAANKAVEAMKPAFRTADATVTTTAIDTALADALDSGKSKRVYKAGDLKSAPPGFSAYYAAGPAPAAPLEPLTATARLTGDRLEVWAPTQAPGLARAAAARASGLDPAQVTIHRTLIGGGYGRKIETAAIEQVVVMALRMKRPVQLVWSRIEETMQDGFRAPARARLKAAMAKDGRVLSWHAAIAAPSTTSQLFTRLKGDSEDGRDALEADASAVTGASPPYDIPAVAIDHFPADPGLRTGLARGGAHGYTAFFTECFIDELARQAGMEPLSFRMQMLGDRPRLARCLSTAAALGGWDGGGSGSAMGIAAHSCFGSHIATLVEVEVSDAKRIRVIRAISAVDCGRVVNPEIVRQVVEAGILHGIGLATGTALGFENGLVTARGFGSLGLPRLADSPEISVELLTSDDPPGGASELGVPTVAPAIANAVFAATGQRLRSLPLDMASPR